MATILVRLKTALPAPYRASLAPLSLPGDTTPDHLTALLNDLLHLDPPEQFDYLIEGKYLRSSLQQFREANQISAEATLVIDYVKPLPPPRPEFACGHDDWVAALAVDSKSNVWTGSYDGRVTVWDAAGKALGTQSQQERPVKALVLLPERVHATGSLDGRLRLWSGSRSLAELVAHIGGVASVAVHAHQLASGGWDNTVRLWDATDPARTVQVAALTGHTGAVSSVAWGASLLSGAWDHSVRMWDPATAQVLRVLAADAVVHAVAGNERLAASGHADGSVRVWDPRAREGPAQLMALRRHKGFVSGVSFAPHAAHLLASVSYDKTLAVWDTRAPAAPLHTVAVHADRALCVLWATADRIATGGADKRLRIVSLAAQQQQKEQQATSVLGRRSRQ